MKNFQFVSWYPEWIGLGKRRFFGYLARIYKWSICLGFWEIRRIFNHDAYEDAKKWKFYVCSKDNILEDNIPGNEGEGIVK